MQPYFEKVWGWNTQSRNGDMGVLRNSQNFRVRLQGSKHFALKRSLYHWKVIKVQMSKMGSHEPFGHLQHKLGQKERLGVKLALWLLTIKSWESTQPWCVEVECDTSLESSRRELQLCFRPCSNRRSEQRVIVPQSCKSPNQDNFRTFPWESRDKKPFGCKCCGEAQRILYGGRWQLPSSLGRGESSESRVAHGLS